jgi:hypothetical protein
MQQRQSDRRNILTYGIALATLSAGSSVFSHEAQAENANMSPNIIEIVSFKLVKGAEDAAFLKAVEATNTFLKSQKGFVARRMSRDETGTYIDHVEWATLDNAKAAVELSMQQPDLVPFLQMIDPNSMSMRHNALVVSIG